MATLSGAVSWFTFPAVRFVTFGVGQPSSLSYWTCCAATLVHFERMNGKGAFVSGKWGPNVCYILLISRELLSDEDAKAGANVCQTAVLLLSHHLTQKENIQ